MNDYPTHSNLSILFFLNFIIKSLPFWNSLLGDSLPLSLPLPTMAWHPFIGVYGQQRKSWVFLIFFLYLTLPLAVEENESDWMREREKKKEKESKKRNEKEIKKKSFPPHPPLSLSSTFFLIFILLFQLQSTTVID